MANRTSHHILSTSANLLGFCLFVITAIHISNKVENTFIDEITSIVALFLTASTLLSFLSIKTHHIKREAILEKIGENNFSIFCSISATSISPTTTIACKSVLYQSW